MKVEEKKEAIRLRKEGWSIKDINKKLRVSKSSVSFWVREIELTPKQKLELSKKGIRKEVIEKRRITRLKNENARRQIIIDQAKKEIKHLSLRDLFLIGTALYWAEGGKTKGIVRFSNSDPKIIQIIMRFFKEVCEISPCKFKGHIHIHPHLDCKKAEKYWSNISGIPLAQFYKSYQKPNKSSQNKKDSLPYGTFDIYICSTELLLKLKGWAEKIHEILV